LVTSPSEKLQARCTVALKAAHAAALTAAAASNAQTLTVLGAAAVDPSKLTDELVSNVVERVRQVPAFVGKQNLLTVCLVMPRQNWSSSSSRQELAERKRG
jgi:hypothetical protein